MISARGYLGIALLMVLAHLAFVWWSFQVGNLVEPIPAHWGFDLSADRFVSFEQHIIELVLLQLLALLFPFLALLMRRRIVAGLFRVAGFGIFLMMQLIIWFISLLQQAPGNQQFPVLLFVGLLVFPLMALVLVLRMPEVAISDRLRIKVSGLTLLALEFDAIEKVELAKLRARDFGGLGIRYAKRKLAFIPRAGSGVELKLKGNESVLIYSPQPEVLQSAIQAKLER